MGVYHCECGETLCGETFPCEQCGYGDGDGNTLCEGCAEVHCAPESEREKGLARGDAALLEHLLAFGVYTGSSKHDRGKSLQSQAVRQLVGRIVSDPIGFSEQVEKLDAPVKQPAKKLKSMHPGAPPKAVLTLDE